MTDQFDPTQKTRAPFADPVTGDQSVPGDEGGREQGADVGAAQGALAGQTTGLPGELFAKPDPDQPVEGRRDQPEDPADQASPSQLGREADADSQTTGH